MAGTSIFYKVKDSNAFKVQPWAGGTGSSRAVGTRASWASRVTARCTLVLAAGGLSLCAPSHKSSKLNHLIFTETKRSFGGFAGLRAALGRREPRCAARPPPSVPPGPRRAAGVTAAQGSAKSHPRSHFCEVEQSLGVTSHCSVVVEKWKRMLKKNWILISLFFSSKMVF